MLVGVPFTVAWLAMLVTLAGNGVFTVTWKLTVILLPAGTVKFVPVTVPAAKLTVPVLEFVIGLLAFAKNVVFAGIKSLKVTPVAAVPPALVIVTV